MLSHPSPVKAHPLTPSSPKRNRSTHSKASVKSPHLKIQIQSQTWIACSCASSAPLELGVWSEEGRMSDGLTTQTGVWMGCSACGVYVHFRVHLPGNRNRTPIINWFETHDIATASSAMTLAKVTCDSDCPQGNNTPPGLTIQHLAHLRLRGYFHKDFNGHKPPISLSFLFSC